MLIDYKMYLKINSICLKLKAIVTYWNGWRIIWPMVLTFMFIHAGAFYGLYLVIFSKVFWATLIWQNLMHIICAPGITAGAHRLWSHRSFKAKWPVRLYLAYAQTLSLQRDIYDWSSDHRLHHKYSETDADPHNAKRGFFYSHMGWILVEKHPEAIKKMEKIDLSDLLEDPIVYYQRKFYIPLVLIIWFAIPVLIPCYFWNESLTASFFINVMRYVFILHCAFFVNSVAHLWGVRPYDKNINPAESQTVTWLTIGEGYHNYHHVFPYDYSTGEYGWEENFNATTMLIEYCARKGWVYDLKRAAPTTIEQTRLKRGLNVNNRPQNILIDYMFGIGVQTWLIWFPLLCKLIY